MYGKIIDGRLQVAGSVITTDKGFISNPTTEQLIELGYKEIDYAEKPEYNKEEEKLVEIYTEQEDVIVVDFDTVALTDEEHNAIIKQEILEEEGKLTNRNIRNAIKGDSFALGKIDEIEANISLLREKLIVIEPQEN